MRPMNRRGALALLGAAAGVGLVGRRLLPPGPSGALASTHDLALDLFRSLDAESRAHACVPYDDPLRQYHNRGVPAGGVSVFSLPREQRRMTTDLLYAGLSEPGRSRIPDEYFVKYPGVHVMKLLFCSDPASPPYQVLLTGPHLNLRIGGASREGVAFGGPQVYGDQRGDSEPGLPGNLYAFQLDIGHRLFTSMTADQRGRALLPSAPIQTQIELRDADEPIPGVAVSTLGAASRAIASELVEGVLSTYPDDDVAFARRCIDENGGVAGMFASFYRDGEVGGSGVHQIFRLEGPSSVLYFRGAPHVHAFVNVAMRAGAPLSVGELLGVNPAAIEGAAVKALFERAMRESTGAELAYYDASGVVGRLRRGPVRSGDIYNLESWQDTVHVSEVKGADLPEPLVDDLRSRGPSPDPRRVYRVAGVSSAELLSLSSQSHGVMLRDATIAYVKAHGLSSG